MSLFFHVKQALLLLSPDGFFSYRTNWIVIHGQKYVKDMAVVYRQSIFPEFILIDDIFILPNTVVVFFL